MSWPSPATALCWDGQSLPHFTATLKAQGCSGPLCPLPKLPRPQVLAWEGIGKKFGAEFPWFWEDTKPTDLTEYSELGGIHKD